MSTIRTPRWDERAQRFHRVAGRATAATGPPCRRGRCRADGSPSGKRRSRVPPPGLEFDVTLQQVQLLAEFPDAAAQRVEQRAMAKLGHADAELPQAGGLLPEGGALLSPHSAGFLASKLPRAFERAPPPPDLLRAAGSSSRRSRIRSSSVTGWPMVAKRGSHSRIAERYALRASHVPGALHELRQRAERHEVQGKLVVRIAEQAAHFVRNSGGRPAYGPQ